MSSKRRLQALYDMIQTPCVLADIGCDHGWLPITAVVNGKCKKAYACDKHEGPLERAKEAILKADLEDQIIPILSDGLCDLQADVDVIVIAGMGYETISTILEQSIERLDNMKQIVLQCNGHEALMRHWISDHGFVIDAERMVNDGHYYQLISIHKGVADPLTYEQCLFGVHMPYDDQFQAYWQLQYQKKSNVLARMPIAHKHYKIFADEIKTIKTKLIAINNTNSLK